jgi:glycine cleavage system aminomethyltransferase T
MGLVVDVIALEEIHGRYGMPLHLPYTSWNDQIPVYATGEQRDPVGKATSGAWSPLLKNYLVIARIDAGHARPGTRLYLEETVEGRRYAVPAEVVKLPFFDPPRKKETLP